MAMKVAKTKPKPSRKSLTPPAKEIAPMGKAGRPTKPIDPKMVIQLAADHFNVEEIAAHLGTVPSVLYDRFSEELNEGWKRGQGSLKRKMHEKALEGKGDSNMLIWLSKQRLGYRDKQPEEVASVTFNIAVVEVPK